MRVRLYLLIWFLMALVAPSALAQADPEQTKTFLDWLKHNWIAVTGTIATISTILVNLDKIIDVIRKYFFPTKPTASAADIQIIRPKLLRRLKNDVNTRLDTTLHHLVKLDLQMEDQRYRVGQPQINLVPEDTQPVNLLNRVFQLFQTPKSRATQLHPTQRIIEVFDRPDIQGKLLILGEPGSGKTTELLTLAQDWLERAENDDTLPLPITFELSAWDGQPIEQWLVAQIQGKYKPKRKTIAKALLDEEQVLLLLDGLDELGLVQQRKCIEAINQFMQARPEMNLVVCCRREEYEQGEAELNQLKGAVYLKPLTTTEIEASLHRWNRHRLWDNIKQQAELLDLAQTPLFLTMLVVAYRGQSIRNTPDLLSAYIKKKLHDPDSQGTYPPGKAPPPEKTLRYLNWLATKLDADNQTEFLIERLQPTWLESDRQRLQQRFWYHLSVELFFGLGGGLWVGLFFGWIFGLWVGLIGGLTLGLIVVGLIGGLTGDREANIVVLRGKPNWSWSRFLFFGLGGGLWVGLIGGLWAGVGLIGGLTLGLIGGLTLGLIGGVLSDDNTINEKETPNQGIRQSGQNGLIAGITFGLGVGLISGVGVGLSDGLTVGLIGGLIVVLIVGPIIGLGVGLDTVVRHCSLRLVLYRAGYSPWNYAQFLNHAAKHRFIQRLGGRYRFMHDLLRKHFASMTSEDIKRLAEG